MVETAKKRTRSAPGQDKAAAREPDRATDAARNAAAGSADDALTDRQLDGVSGGIANIGDQTRKPPGT